MNMLMVPYPYMRTLYPISPYLNPVYHPDAVEYLNSYYNLYDGELIAESKCVYVKKCNRIKSPPFCDVM